MNKKANETKGKLLSEIAYEKIKEAIITSDLEPGQEVTESQLADQFNFGKAPIRHALASLAKESLILPQKRKGYKVTPLTMKDIHDVWAIRLLLEPEAARMAAGNIDKKHLEKLDQTFKKTLVGSDLESKKAYLAANKEFHLSICKASGNPHLVKILEYVLDHMSRMLFLGIIVSSSVERFEHDHAALIKALADGDADLAANITKEHLEVGRNSVLNSVMKSSALLNVNIVPKVSAI